MNNHHLLGLVLCDDKGPSTGADSEKPLPVWALTVLLFDTQVMQQRMTNEEEAEATEKRYMEKMLRQKL